MAPPDPWPGTKGGAYSPHWGGNIKLFVWAGIYAGSNMKWGPAATDRLNAGNVWAGSAQTPTPPSGQIWIDLSCDVLELETRLGGTRADGAVLAAADAGTVSITLADPTRKYDPSNPQSPYQYGGQTRLTPGVSLLVWCEYWTGSAIVKRNLITATVDSWGEDWELRPENRQAKVEGSDSVKELVNMNFGAQPPAGAGDTVNARIQRVLTAYSYTKPSALDVSTNTLQATT